MLSGREALESIDDGLRAAREGVARTYADYSKISADLAVLQRDEMGLYTKLARIRLEDIERGEALDALEGADRRVRKLLEERETAVRSLDGRHSDAKDRLESLEVQRSERQIDVETAARVLDAAEADVQQNLADDADYKSRLAAAEEADFIADQAESKAEEANADRVGKGQPYESDRLFMYLWNRRFGTPAYRAWGLTRMLDRWVARLAKYEELRRNYSMLCEIPVRLSEHASRMRATADAELAKLQALEEQAAEAAGLPSLQRDVTKAEGALAATDEAITAAESAVQEILEEQARYANCQDDYLRNCLLVLREALKREDLSALRKRAEGTRNPEDDAVVAELLELEGERERLERDVAQYRRLYDAQVARVAEFEDVRHRFKSRRFDDPHSGFVNGVLIATILNQLLGGTATGSDVWDVLKRQQRYRHIRANPVFGTGRFPRAPKGGPWQLPRGKGWKMPRGGGFRTGGGFRGGGGFKTGGGF
jgi:hypothetical protein